MLTAKDVGGLMAMMPAFATDEAKDIRARNTISVARLHSGLDRMIKDGANVIATTGSFGECHTLLPDEFETLAQESAAVVDRRVPLFIGVTAPNAREAMERAKIVARTRADGLLVGIPYYFPSTQANALRFIRGIASEFPKLNILLYHNPVLHRITLELPLFEEFVKIPQLVGMKDSHRDTITMMKLLDLTRGKISVMVNQLQYVPFAGLGAAGFWSIDAWMGPWPLLALRDAVARGDTAHAKAIIMEIAPPTPGRGDLSWRETASKIAIRRAGYVDPGPLRAPFLEIPADVEQATMRKAERWKGFCEKYRPAYASKAA